MGWLSKIFKCSDHNVLDGHCEWRYGADTAETRRSASLNSRAETEDIDCAIALSLSEEDVKGKSTVSTVEREPQLEEDERLARALQESLIVGSQPESWSRNDTGNGYGYGNTGNGYGYGSGYEYGYGYGYGNDNLYQPITFPYSTSLRICAGCNTDIGHGRLLSCMNAVWHPQCFRCRGCNQPISDYEFSVSGSYPYHKACYKESHHPKCDVCRHFIPTNAAGLIEYRAHPFWAQKYCPRHEHDGTPRCCSCERMESWDARYAALNDGRKLCLECLDSVIMDTRECQPLFREIQDFYKGLNMKLTQEVPLFLVEKQALNQAMGGERNGQHHHMPETRGLCLSEEQTITTVSRRPRIGAGNRATGMLTQPYKLTRHCEVTAILILYGLPRLLTGTILAHEMMHAWLRLNGYRTLRQDVEEGICQVMASMWLESQILSMSDNNNASTSNSVKGSTSPFDKKLSQFFKHQMATDPSVVYGDGFRAGHQAVVKFGFQRTLDYIRKTGNFPH